MVEDNTGELSAMGFLSGKYIAQHYSMLLHKLDYCCRLSTVHSHYMILESVCGSELASTDLAGLHEGGNCLLQLLDKVAVVFVVTEHPAGDCTGRGGRDRREDSEVRRADASVGFAIDAGHVV
jgi:hypothetical protein